MTKIRKIKYLAGSPWFSFSAYSFFLLFTWPFQTGQLSGLGLQCAGSHLEVVPEADTEQTASLTCALGLVSPGLDIRRGRLLFGVTDERCCKWAVLVCFLVHLLTVCMTFSYRKPSDGSSMYPSGEVLFCALPAGLWALFPKPWTLPSFYCLSSCTWLTWVASQK